jgi:hypothetical protein
MIWIFNLERASAGVCDSYTDVYEYIRGIEGLTNPEGSELLEHNIELPANAHEPEQKQWCINFCKDNNYVIIETPSHAVNSEHTSWNTRVGSFHSDERFKQAS